MSNDAEQEYFAGGIVPMHLRDDATDRRQPMRFDELTRIRDPLANDPLRQVERPPAFERPGERAGRQRDRPGDGEIGLLRQRREPSENGVARRRLQTKDEFPAIRDLDPVDEVMAAADQPNLVRAHSVMRERLASVGTGQVGHAIRCTADPRPVAWREPGHPLPLPR